MLKAYFLIAISGLSVLPVALSAEEQTATWVNTYGLSGGLIDMPTAEVGPDGRLVTTISHFGGTTKTNLSFQLTPRISGVFRYDLVVAAILMSMGMMMVPPAVVALPFKLSFFVLADGWRLLTEGLVRSYF